jgi:hypothetical protein
MACSAGGIGGIAWWNCLVEMWALAKPQAGHLKANSRVATGARSGKWELRKRMWILGKRSPF